MLTAGVHVFARRGYWGTSTAEVAAAAGISQPYIYRLFTDKESLFVHVIDFVSAQMREALGTAASQIRTADSGDVLAAMNDAYSTLIADQDFLMVLLHANSAVSEPRVRVALQDCYAKQVEYIRAISGADDAQIRTMMASNLLDNVMTAIGATAVDAPWARTLTGHASRPGQE